MLSAISDTSRVGHRADLILIYVTLHIQRVLWVCPITRLPSLDGRGFHCEFFTPPEPSPVKGEVLLKILRLLDRVKRLVLLLDTDVLITLIQHQESSIQYQARD